MVQNTCHSKVPEFHISFPIQKDIRWLQVTMKYLTHVCSQVTTLLEKKCVPCVLLVSAGNTLVMPAVTGEILATQNIPPHTTCNRVRVSLCNQYILYIPLLVLPCLGYECSQVSSLTIFHDDIQSGGSPAYDSIMIPHNIRMT